MPVVSIKCGNVSGDADAGGSIRMTVNMYNVVRRIEELTGIDLQNKSIFELYASLCEEVGELSRELKIEERSFGNAHKAPDEGSEIESVDVAICALALYFARGGKNRRP